LRDNEREMKEKCEGEMKGTIWWDKAIREGKYNNHLKKEEVIINFQRRAEGERVIKIAATMDALWLNFEEKL